MERGDVLLELDGVAPGGVRPGPLAFSRPLREVVARTLAEVRGALAAVEAESAAGRWAAGFVSYEAAPALDPALRAHPPGPLPLVWFGIYDAPLSPALSPRSGEREGGEGPARSADQARGSASDDASLSARGAGSSARDDASLSARGAGSSASDDASLSARGAGGSASEDASLSARGAGGSASEDASLSARGAGGSASEDASLSARGAGSSASDDASLSPRAAGGEGQGEGGGAEGSSLGPMVPAVDRARHLAAVERIRARIARGDVYQVNHTLRLRGPFRGDPLHLYRRLRAAQGGGLGALVHLGDRAIVSASPELFLARRGDAVVARPMKGTAPRGRWEEEDAASAAALVASAKERAENVMIVDLVRNDLGRVAVPGSVRVSALLALERYRTVHQLTSTVEATLRPGTALGDLLAATFPCGSITGAPKAMATAIVAEEEDAPRGVYCGAIGVVAPGGDAAFSVAIRTVALDLAAGLAEVGVGGGITWDSDAAQEWEEALAKGAFLAAAPAPFELLETLRLEDGAYPLLDGHLARLAASARHLGFAVDPRAVEAALRREAAAAAGAPRRVRLRVAADGAVRTEAAALPGAGGAPQPVALAARRVSSRDWTLFHKTTLRATYDAARAGRTDVLDVLLANERDEVTEFTIGNVVLDLDGARVTPPREAGLLAGVMRGALLARGELVERPVRVADLPRARAMWLVNAVRGAVPVRLVP